MNRTQIEWCDYTWNPGTGCTRLCRDPEGQIYCYAYHLATTRLQHRYPNGFAPTFWPERLEEPYAVKKPSRIFVCSMGNLFELKPEEIRQIRQVMRECAQHTFIIPTKDPRQFERWSFPENCWLGVSIDRQEHAAHRKNTLVRYVRENIRFISFEPLLERIQQELWGIDWVIIGGKTGTTPFIPPREWVDALITDARLLKIPVFLKDNVQFSFVIREFPPKIPLHLRRRV